MKRSIAFCGSFTTLLITATAVTDAKISFAGARSAKSQDTCPARPRTKLPEHVAQLFAASLEEDPAPRRWLQEDLDNATTSDVTAYDPTRCSICRGAEIWDGIPDYDPTEELPANLTCIDFEALSQEFFSLEECEDSGVVLLYPQCCRGSIPRYTCESNIRKSILNDYDPAIPPIIGPGKPLNVSVDVQFQAIEKLDVQAGTTSIYLTMNFFWKDPRLAWNISETTCADSVTAFAALNLEKTELWVPELDLYNQAEGVQNLPDTMATIYSDGTVFWNRNGGLDVLCQFTGLSKIPFDTLGCQLLMGPWVRLDPRQITYEPVSLRVGAFVPPYNEYLPVPEQFDYGKTFDGVFLFYTFYFRRSKSYYVFNLVIPTVILTYVSFGTFLLDLRVGERLSYGLALALVVVAQQIVTGSLVPVSNERLWIDKFIGWSFYWVIVGLLESVFMGYLFFLREDHSDKRENRYSSMNPRRFFQMYQGRLSSSMGLEESNGDKRDRQPHTPYVARPFSASQSNQAEAEDWIENPSSPVKNGLEFGQNVSDQDVQMTSQAGQSNNGKRAVDTDQYHTKKRCCSWMYTISIRRVDRFFFFFTVTTYTAYLIAMFVSIPHWGQRIKNPFATSQTEPPDGLSLE